ncbi:MAG TPA: PilN domain-containing protein [Actinomycetota bacterium]
MASRRINLLPPDLAHRRRIRQIGAAIGAAGLALVAVLALVYVVQEVRLRGERSRLEEQEDRNATISSEIASLREFGELGQQLDRRIDLINDLAADEVRWSVVLADVSLVIPPDVWLTQFSGAIAGGEDATTLGSVDMGGTGFAHVDVATWLTRLERVDAFAFPYLSLSQRAQLGQVSIVNFSSSVQLSTEALRANQRGAQRDI